MLSAVLTTRSTSLSFTIIGTTIVPLKPLLFIFISEITSATACLIVSRGASMFVPLFWSPRIARNSLLGGITAPVARRGMEILPKSTFEKLNPNFLPPIPGTHILSVRHTLLLGSLWDCSCSRLRFNYFIVLTVLFFNNLKDSLLNNYITLKALSE